MRSSVVLPAPFGPQRPTVSRSDTCQVTSSRRTLAPNDLVTDDSWIIANGGPSGGDSPRWAGTVPVWVGKVPRWAGTVPAESPAGRDSPPVYYSRRTARVRQAMVTRAR